MSSSDEMMGQQMIYTKPFNNGEWDDVAETFIYIQYAAPLFWIFGGPTYFFCFWFLHWFNFISGIFNFFKLFGDYAPDSEDAHIYTFWKWTFWVLRKHVVYDLLFLVGNVPIFIPFFGAFNTIGFGAMQWMNLIFV